MQGAESSRWEKGASAILSVQLDDSIGGVAKQVMLSRLYKVGKNSNATGRFEFSIKF